MAILRLIFLLPLKEVGSYFIVCDRMPVHYRSLSMNNGRCTKYFQYFLITPNIVVLFLQTKLSIVGTHFISFLF